VRVSSHTSASWTTSVLSVASPHGNEFRTPTWRTSIRQKLNLKFLKRKESSEPCATTTGVVRAMRHHVWSRDAIRSHEVRNYYDSQSKRRRPCREQDAILSMRTANNVVKRKLIQRACPYPGARMLDLACGRGGDVHKAKQVGVCKCVGVDISLPCVIEARRRARATGLADFEVIQADIFDTWPERIAQESPFDMIICHFAIHYASSPECLCSLFANMASVLRRGAKLTLTWCNFDYLSEVKADKKTHPHARISFPNTSSGILNEFEEYTFNMEDAVAFGREYAIPLSHIEAAARLAGMLLLESDVFDALAEYDGDTGKLYRYAIFTKGGFEDA
jgi:cyclopropane fatty-acyl-phospholipid synthase-like methyltransferase